MRASFDASRLGRTLALLQGGYYVIMGLWPLLHIDSFQLVTGGKTDLWLVRTVGMLVLVVGATLLLSARREMPPFETVALGALSALGFILVDTIFVAQDLIRPIYLLDALVEAIILLGWLLVAAGVGMVRRQRAGRAA